MSEKKREISVNDTGPRELTEGEWAIMKVVWENEPCPAPKVQELLAEETGWTYSTVKTLLDRMAKKGLLKMEKLCNLILYRSAVSIPQARKGELARTLKRAFDGSLTPMMQFLLESSEFSKSDLDSLASLIQQKRKQVEHGKSK